MTDYILVHWVRSPGGSAADDTELVRAAALGEVDGAVARGLYKATALVEADGPEDLFARTQNIDEAWTQRHPPKLGVSRQRSTSVGDFVVDLNTRDVWLCASFGWDPVTGQVAEVIRSIASGLPGLEQLGD